MKQVIVLKLAATPEQHEELLKTMEAFNLGCRYVAEVAFEKRLANKIALQKLVYGHLRATFGLKSQLAIRCIDKCCGAYKRDKNIKPTFKLNGAMVYDDRCMTFKGASHVSLTTLTDRLLIPLCYGKYQAERLCHRMGQADLVLRDANFYLYVTIDLPTPPEIAPIGFIGVDLGIAEIATDSEEQYHSGEPIKAIRRRVREHRRQLQKKRSRSSFKRPPEY